jgi:hypothetical protein
MDRLFINAGRCKKCNSPLTGPLKKGSKLYREFGFFGITVYDPLPGNYNCTCAACNVRWYGELKKNIITKDEIKRLKKEFNKLPPLEDNFISEDEYYDEDIILEELVDGLKRENYKSKNHSLGGTILKETIGAPIQSIISLARDIPLYSSYAKEDIGEEDLSEFLPKEEKGLFRGVVPDYNEEDDE